MKWTPKRIALLPVAVPWALFGMRAVKRANRLTREGRYEEAYNLLQKWVPRPWNMVEVGLLMCRLQIRLNRWEEIPEMLRKIEKRIKSDPTYSKTKKAKLLGYAQDLGRHGATILECQTKQVDPRIYQDIALEELDTFLSRRS